MAAGASFHDMRSKHTKADCLLDLELPGGWPPPVDAYPGERRLTLDVAMPAMHHVFVA